MLCADVLAAASRNPVRKNEQNLTPSLRFIVPSTFRFVPAFSIRLELWPGAGLAIGYAMRFQHAIRSGAGSLELILAITCGAGREPYAIGISNSRSNNPATWRFRCVRIRERRGAQKSAYIARATVR